ncbi:autotransporter outer membrane beta-barrel domain-containing protein [Helicobacter cinaedi]|uniref:autotransporter outer membrane beta-barrel domain-containing protein n=1 Tax=Helicobacter cinaedi TaxID=213 RepID=UPI001F1D9BE9|nr:autotransporter outer membrane beta-barrel domain-containing protein [Helicobacter cinaedi]
MKLNLPLWRLSSLYRLKILCVVLYAPLFLYGIDYTGRLPSQITLQNGVNQVSNAMPTCVSMRGCNFNYNWTTGAGGLDFSYSTANGGSSTLTLNAQMPTQTYGQTSLFYFDNLNIGNNSKLIINNFYSLIVNKSITLNPYSSFEVSLQKGSSGNKSSQFYLTDRTNVILTQDSSFVIKNGDLFISNGSINIENQATLDIDSTNIRLHKSLSNRGTLNLKGDLWAVGTEGVLTSPATTIIENYGTLNLTGNFHNGGTLNSIYKEQGAGKLLNYGGSIHITGNLTNQSEGGEHSSVQIYGGSIKVDGSMTNAADSSLIFGAYNGKLGQLIGNVNNQGKIQVDIAGAELGSHQLIVGNLSGKQDIEILASGGKSEFINSSSQGNGSIKLEKNTQAIDTFLQSLDKNQNSILTSLESNLEQDSKSLYTYGDRAFLTNLSSNIDTSANILSTQAPSLSLWSIMQNTTLPLIYQPPMKRFSFNLTPFASNANSANLSTPLYGTSLSATLQQRLYSLSVFATYATSQGTSALDSTQTHLNSTALLIGTYSKLTLPRLEFTLLTYYGNTQHTSKREVFFSSSTFQGKLSYNELGLQSTLGYPISFQKFHIKPFVGLSYTLGMQGIFAESQANNTNMPTLSLKAQQHHTLSLLLGTQMCYYFGSRHILFGGLNLQYVPTPTQQTTAYFGNSPLYFQSPQTLGYTLHLGGSVPLHKHISLSLYALYAQSPMQFKTYSGTLNLSYYF